MNKNDNELNKYREMMYRLLSSIYIEEIDTETLEALKALTFPEFPEKCAGWQMDMKAGFDLVTEYLAGFDGKSEKERTALLEDLAADYAKTFLAAGDATGKAAFPYESVYAGTDSQFGGSIQMRLAADYAAKGFEMKKNMFRIMEDHIGLEFGFMAELLKRQAQTEDEKEAGELEADMKKFFREHLQNWTASFAADVYRYSERGFYKGIARVTRGFTEAEKMLLS